MNSMVSEYLRTATYPVGVKIFKKGEEVPADIRAKSPVKDFGHRLAMCQGITMARKLGTVMKYTMEDQSCPLGQFILGFAEVADIIKDGSVAYPLYTKTLEAGKITQDTTPRMPAADIGAVVVAPLHRANFEPDVIVIYGNGAQIIRMVQGAIYETGGYVESHFSGRGCCGSEISTPYSLDKCNVTIPGGGERVFGLTSDDELAFSVPKSKFRSFLEGVIATHKAGAARIPTPIGGLTTEPNWPHAYQKLYDYYNK
jgi:uncharacterized protein (DUF169 family)